MIIVDHDRLREYHCQTLYIRSSLPISAGRGTVLIGTAPTCNGCLPCDACDMGDNICEICDAGEGCTPEGTCSAACDACDAERCAVCNIENNECPLDKSDGGSCGAEDTPLCPSDDDPQCPFECGVCDVCDAEGCATCDNECTGEPTTGTSGTSGTSGTTGTTSGTSGTSGTTGTTSGTSGTSGTTGTTATTKNPTFNKHCCGMDTSETYICLAVNQATYHEVCDNAGGYPAECTGIQGDCWWVKAGNNSGCEPPDPYKYVPSWSSCYKP